MTPKTSTHGSKAVGAVPPRKPAESDSSSGRHPGREGLDEDVILDRPGRFASDFEAALKRRRFFLIEQGLTGERDMALPATPSIGLQATYFRRRPGAWKGNSAAPCSSTTARRSKASRRPDRSRAGSLCRPVGDGSARPLAAGAGALPGAAVDGCDARGVHLAGPLAR